MGDEKDEPGVKITLVDIYYQLRKLQDQVNDMSPMAHTLADHENRMRAIEKWKYGIPIAVVVAIIDSVIAFSQVHGK